MLSVEHRGFNVISMEEFLDKVDNGTIILNGDDSNSTSNSNSTSTSSNKPKPPVGYYKFTMELSSPWGIHPIGIHAWDCALTIPSSTDPEAITELQKNTCIDYGWDV